MTLTLGHSIALWYYIKKVENYSVKQVAKMAGISVRALHVYDKMGLLKPLKRSAAGYREYGEAELLRLQQILFYKEMDLSLQHIAAILDKPGFNLIDALLAHRDELQKKQGRLNTMIGTIDKTIGHLKNNTMKNYEELYEGFSAEEAKGMRAEAMQKWPEETAHAEKQLLKGGKQNFEALKREQEEITEALVKLMGYSSESPEVQFEIARHYQNIRSFWGTNGNADKQTKQYAGLGELYLADKRYTRVNGEPNEQFGAFMAKAMKSYADKFD